LRLFVVDTNGQTNFIGLCFQSDYLNEVTTNNNIHKRTIMKIQNKKMAAAFVGAISLTTQATTTLPAASLVKFSGDNINSMLALKAGQHLTAKTTVGLKTGSKKVRFDQYYQGIKVFGHSIAATQSAMGVYSHVSGLFANIDSLSVKGKISPERALSDFIASHEKANVIENQQHERLIVVHNGKPLLVNRVSFVRYGKNQDDISRPTAFLDANNGEILWQYDNLQHFDATGPGGNEKTGQRYYGTDFGSLQVTQQGDNCIMQGNGVKVINMDHATSGGEVYQFSCPENTYKAINGAYSPLNDALYYGTALVEMYERWVGVQPLSFDLGLRVHFGSEYENAFWDGTNMSFGDGKGSFYPLVVMDVLTHEVSHGFTEQNAGFIFSGSSGALNESFSDLAGEAGKYFINGSNDWRVGGDVFKNGEALRYMNDPTSDGRSIDHVADHTSSTDVHYASGIFNKANYLLATTTGWNTEMVFKANALANQIYWQARTSFDEGACGIYQAATDLGYNGSDVTRAFAQVGVQTCDGVVNDIVLGKDQPVVISGGYGSQTFYRFDVPENVDTAKVAILGGTGNADIIVKHGSRPSLSTYDCRKLPTDGDELCLMDPAKPGSYYVMVWGYDAYQDVTLVANYSEKVTGNGQVMDLTLAQGEWYHHDIYVPQDMSTLTVRTTKSLGDADLYVRFDEQPSKYQYDCRPYLISGDETCVIDAPQSGQWYFGVRGYTQVDHLDLHWAYE
jgi:vibriolysin